jgi:hypothetical protein
MDNYFRSPTSFRGASLLPKALNASCSSHSVNRERMSSYLGAQQLLIGAAKSVVNQ